MSDATAAKGWVDRAAIGCATLFGIGRSPFAPGTCGALAALPCWWLASGLPRTVAVGTLFGLTAVAMLVAERAGRALSDPDASCIVIDELVGCLFALVLFAPSLLAAGVAFAAFRLFDIKKPWPVGWIDRTGRGGVACVLDDVVAGVYAAVVTAVISSALA